jgi:hypothetical protein
MNARESASMTHEDEWRRSIRSLINACSLRYPDLSAQVKIDRRLIEQWGKGNMLKNATLGHYVRLLEFFTRKRFSASVAGMELWRQIARYLDNQEHDEEPHIYVFDTVILCNRAYLISRMKAVRLIKSEAAELFGTSLKYIRWATDESKDPGELLYLSIDGYRKIIETYGEAWYLYNH